MKRIQLIPFFILTTLLSAESAWQHIPLDDRAAGIHGTGSMLVAFLREGDIQATADGIEWEQVGRFGDPTARVWIKHVQHTEAGINVWMRETRPETGYARSRIYQSPDGQTWTVALDTDPGDGRLECPDLSEPVEIDGGWMVYSFWDPPATIWFSEDCQTWESVYQDDDRVFAKGIFNSRGNPALKFTEPHETTWLESENGRDWNAQTLTPLRIIEGDGFRVGVNNMPGGNGSVFYEADGQEWQRVFTPAGGAIPQYLVLGGGTFLMINRYSHIYFSDNGLDWEPAVFPADAISHINSPLNTGLKYQADGFWYKLITPTSPRFPDKEPEVFTFHSVDGSVWEQAEFPYSFDDELIWSIPFPDPTSIPRPGHNPLTDDLLPEKEVSAAGYSLKMVPIPEGRKMGLYLAEESGEFTVVPSSWNNHGASYPYTPPVDIAVVNNRFFALTDDGRLGLFDPVANYLPQPVSLNVSMGTYDDRIELDWEPVPEADFYRVFRIEPEGEGGWQPMADVQASEFVDTIDLELDVVYRYRVEARGSGRRSLPAGSASGRLHSVLRDSFYEIWDGSGIIVDWFEFPVDSASTNKPRLRITDATYYPWIYSSSHGWQYCLESPGNLWLWDPQLGWLWTRQRLYPNLYVASEKDWITFLVAGDSVRWFYRYGCQTFFPLNR